ncbi:MAG: Peptide methionine sulfoxide reductase MsrB [Pseudomonadota bacterium]|jgi:peptide-methionine (R)-S-oxide reductase
MIDRRQLLIKAAGSALLINAAAQASAFAASTSGERFEVTLSESEWRKRLTPDQFAVLRDHSTERAGSSPLDHEKRRGVFVCAGCNLDLYRSEDKFDSGTGWPSFIRPIKDAVRTSIDRSLFSVRIEVHCRRCGGHLGHVFDDGPAPTGKRYCMNGIAMKFRPV